MFLYGILILKNKNIVFFKFFYFETPIKLDFNVYVM